MAYLVRPAQPNDAPAIARIHVESWRTTYQGLMPDEVLANLSVERRENYWRDTITKPDAPEFVLVAEADGGVVGFASGGPEREKHPVYTGELYAIYLLESDQGRGIGRALAAQVARRLVDQGFTTMLVWVLTGNPACHFYAALGGHEVGRKPFTMNDVPLEEIAYGYDDIRPLAETAT